MKPKKIKDVQSYYDLIAALRQRGALVNRVGFVRHPLFQMGGMVLTINMNKVHVFEYSDRNTQRKDFNKLLSQQAVQVKVDTNGQPLLWAWSRGALIILYHGTERSVLDLVTDTLGAFSHRLGQR